ncbi:ribonuclease, Rne/Rng family [Hoeflea phototrophica DFL-43]|uniref:Ribonuclease E n=1 Tax=Hoeflea phototrophica (strain DSM 17068 / NCIMB 14078 / DFL-43) TaxID=411684 RepID=A9D586_HOEPD|nr:Rne/Rng family ribonuclease [Hoeflea phototrophica]EDQ34059.1 ribonuclease, Rne/Rng family [Hoeflea phototrophica DFL-43]
MAEKMLIDASHPEETRVVVVRGNRIEEFDFESQHKKQLRGNIYLAKVTRVEPSLQAAFVDYGGNRHGFLAFSEIHPDYYQIPLADRQALLQAEAEDAANDPDFDNSDEPEVAKPKPKRQSRSKSQDKDKAKAKDESESGDDAEGSKSRPRRSRRGKKNTDETANTDTEETTAVAGEAAASEADASPDAETGGTEAESAADAVEAASDDSGESAGDQSSGSKGDDKPTEMAADVEADEISEPAPRRRRKSRNDDDGSSSDDNGGSEDDDVESVGSEDAQEELPARPQRKPRKQYRIQEVIKRRQILLVQVVKEERGNKGAALTTYLSLAGRYSVLMPNTARGGGISRKITNLPDRKRLKEIARELEVPQGMGVILRTAGANRTKVEVKRDFEYLMRLWENVRNLTLQSTAPSLVYEEGSLIKRSIRDLYNKDISEIVVSGEEGYREAKDFMKMLMPSHAKVVQPYRDLHPIFARSGIEAQLDRMLQPQVTLKSGGYIIINQTEALVAIDVNSGRSTREHSIEDTALQTNLEAADEVARQLRLRDLAGLIVIDFIDMEENRNNRAVEKRMKDCLKNDRARIQVGRISHFGLLEMSRQRIRASVLESTMQVCPTCGGNGHIRSQSSVALHVLRGVEEHLLKNTTHDIIVRTTGDTALYMLNHKRDTVVGLENMFGVSISFSADETVGANHFAIDRGAAVEKPVNIDHITVSSPAYPEDDDDPEIPVDDAEEAEENGDASEAQDARGEERNEDGTGRKRRRRRRRGGRKSEGENGNGDERAASSDETASDDGDDDDESSNNGNQADSASDGDGERRGKRRRRGKRGGRRNREDETQAGSDAATDGDTASDADSAPETDAPSPEATAAIEHPAETSSDAGPVTEAVQAEPEPEAEKKPARKRRRTKAQIAADEAAKAAEAGDDTAEAAGDAAPVEAETAAAAPVVTEAAVVADDAETGKPEEDRRNRTDLGAIASEPVVTSSSEKPEEAEKPKKGGWWQKRGFF